MLNLSIQKIAEWCAGQVITGNPALTVSGVSIDSRRIEPGNLFFAIKGERLDGHQFMAQVVQARAAAAVVSRAWVDENPDFNEIALVAVDDTLIAFQEVAHRYRLQFDIPCIAITGSNGKTTTKDLTARVLASQKTVLSTMGNFNNHIGLPLTLLRLRPEHEVLVVELGMNHLGEIDQLSRLAQPNVGAITNIGPVHLEFLGSVDNVYRAKLELADHVQTLIVNGDDPKLVEQARRKCDRILTFGFNPGCDFRATEVHANGLPRTVFNVEQTTFELPIPGRHNVYNALAAVAIARQYDYSWEIIAAALKEARITALRSEVIELTRLTLLNDTYNANPASMVSSLDMLRDFQTKGRRIAVLGDMFELGRLSDDMHYQLGQRVAEAAVDHLILIGPKGAQVRQGAVAAGMDNDCIEHYDDLDQTTQILSSAIAVGDVVLIKGSRGMHMEQLVDHLKHIFGGDKA